MSLLNDLQIKSWNLSLKNNIKSIGYKSKY